MYPRVASNQRYSPMPRMGQAQAIPPRPTGTPRGESPSYDQGFGGDVYQPPGAGGGFSQPPGTVMDGQGPSNGIPRNQGDAIRQLRRGGPAVRQGYGDDMRFAPLDVGNWSAPNAPAGNSDYFGGGMGYAPPGPQQRSVSGPIGSGGDFWTAPIRQDYDNGAKQQMFYPQNAGGFPSLYSPPGRRTQTRGMTLDQANGALQQEIADNAASQRGLGSLDGPITEDDERQTIGGPNGRMTVADMKRQRQRASQALRQQELKSQQERAAVDSVMQEFPGINPDIANAILQKRQQQSLADGRARANQELGINQTPAPQPISGGMGRPALPQVRMPQMPAPSFPIQRFGGSGTYY